MLHRWRQFCARFPQLGATLTHKHGGFHTTTLTPVFRVSFRVGYVRCALFAITTQNTASSSIMIFCFSCTCIMQSVSTIMGFGALFVCLKRVQTLQTWHHAYVYFAHHFSCSRRHDVCLFFCIYTFNLYRSRRWQTQRCAPMLRLRNAQLVCAHKHNCLLLQLDRMNDCCRGSVKLGQSCRESDSGDEWAPFNSQLLSMRRF